VPVPPLRRSSRAPFLIALLLLAAVAVAAVALASAGGGSRRARRAAAHGVRARARSSAAARSHPALVPPAQPTARAVRVPILMYHRVHAYATELTKSLPDLTVEPDRFAAEIAALAQAGYHSITIAQLFGALYHGAPLPPRPVLVSVDDGYVDDVTQILPVLRAHRMTAVFFIITGRFHEPGFVSAAQVRELDAAGMDIGAHTRDHVDLPGLASVQLDDEVAGSRRDLERLLGHPVAAFAYPAGRFDAAAIEAVRRARFALAVTTQPGSEESSLHPFELPRIRVGRATTPAQLVGCLGGSGVC
jgi:peptidoglycan/xylan/chitin deacetylase (PgdA/CDA1 family)